MALTKAGVKARLVQIAKDANTPTEIKLHLDRLADLSPKLGRPDAQIAAKVEAVLAKDPAVLEAREFTRAVSWILDRWDSLPD